MTDAPVVDEVRGPRVTEGVPEAVPLAEVEMETETEVEVVVVTTTIEEVEVTTETVVDGVPAVGDWIEAGRSMVTPVASH